MSKVTKKELQYQINGLAAEASTRHNSIMRIHRALASIGVDVFSDDFDLTEPEPQPQLKQLDQSIFNGLDEKWRFAAVDEDGECWTYTYRPAVVPVSGNWTGANKPVCFGTGYDASNWQDSLIERDIAKELLEVDLSSELTGSELCRAMLERGDKYVLCHLSQTSEKSAKDVLGIAIGHDHSGFRVQRHNSWRYAVPINNQGEPLTQSDVGL